MSGYDAILFDKDGTLFDFQASYGGWASTLVTDLAGGDPVLRETLAAEIDLDTENRRFGPQSIVIAGTAEEIAALLLPHLPDWPSLSALVAHIDRTAAHVPLEPAVPLAPYLAALAGRGLRLGVVTNDSEAPARAHLERSGILGAFGYVVGYDSGHGAKPAPGPLLAAAKALGAAPGRTIMVGDSRHDLLAGRSAGMTTVAVLTGPATGDDLAPYADVVLPDIGHLPDWLDRAAAAQ
jgi:phosphoglycolate phosphatase